MSASRACIRLWIVGSATWILFWLWNYTSRCVRMHGVLWCPSLGDDAISPTSLLGIAANVFGPPLASGLLGWLCLVAIRATHRHLAGEAPGPDDR